MRWASDYVPRKPQTVIASSVGVSSAAIEIQAARVVLHTIFKVTKLWNDFRGRTFTIHEVGYPKVGYERVSRYTFFILVIDIIIGILAQLNEFLPMVYDEFQCPAHMQIFNFVPIGIHLKLVHQQ